MTPDLPDRVPSFFRDPQDLPACTILAFIYMSTCPNIFSSWQWIFEFILHRVNYCFTFTVLGSSALAMDYSWLARPSVATLATFILIWISYLVGLVFYRLYLSPLSKFPGPNLAAASKWYEFYYDVVLGGQFTFQIQRMHRKYGMNNTTVIFPNQIF